MHDSFIVSVRVLDSYGSILLLDIGWHGTILCLKKKKNLCLLFFNVFENGF